MIQYLAKNTRQAKRREVPRAEKFRIFGLFHEPDGPRSGGLAEEKPHPWMIGRTGRMGSTYGLHLQRSNQQRISRGSDVVGSE